MNTHAHTRTHPPKENNPDVEGLKNKCKQETKKAKYIY